MSNLSVKPFTTYGKRVAKWVFNTLPSMELKNGRVLNAVKWAGQHISSPQNRVILGATALMSQPFIDLHNRNVDDETRKVSAARTVAKILAGTTTGFFVRYYAIKAVDFFTLKPDKTIRTVKSLLFPRGVNTTIKGMQQYKLALGTFISLGVMMFTNFAIDAPLTKVLTNMFVKKIKEHERKKVDNSIMTNPIPTVSNDKEKPKNNTYIHRPSMDSFISRKEAK
ncbi:hypothetical protein J6O86_07835 [bacterium]|nr:hypothetical protein [bacterium]